MDLAGHGAIVRPKSFASLSQRSYRQESQDRERIEAEDKSPSELSTEIEFGVPIKPV